MGRSLKSCQLAYSDLNAIYSGHPVYPRYTPYAPPVEPLGPRRLPPPIEGPLSNLGGRMLQPRPPGSVAMFSPNLEEPVRKKRGRPTNAEMARKAEEAAARGEVYPPPPKKPRPGKTDQPSPKPSTTSEAPQAFAGSPPVTPSVAPSGERVPSTPTAPTGPGSESILESSSSRQQPSVYSHEGTGGVAGGTAGGIVGEGARRVDESQETPSRITTTLPERPEVPRSAVPVEGSHAPPIPSTTSSEEVQQRPDTTTTITTAAPTTFPESKTN
ncbi:MAG: hypothetical protein M1821_003230 [Bathelium mastoideum]|nr:MAG: hypothetical protein M1821_003230 [Bathelium mastoideum]